VEAEPDNRQFGVAMTLTAPLGATVQVFDLFGRDMRLAGFIGLVNNFVIGDPDGNGIPNFNDGIGRVVINGTDSLSTFTMFGGTINLAQGFQITPNPIGIYDDIQNTGGFGFDLTTDNPPKATGLPRARARSSSARPSSGQRQAACPRACLSGRASSEPIRASSLTAGTRSAASTSTAWCSDHRTSPGGGAAGDREPDGLVLGERRPGQLCLQRRCGPVGADDSNVSVATGGQLVVGRTVGEIDVGGRMLMNTTVLGDMARPTIHQPGAIFQYFEKEWSPNIGTTPQPVATITRILNNGQFMALDKVLGGIGLFFGRSSQQMVFADSYMRNDTIMGAEWIGSAATAVQINGELGANDPVLTRQDPSDVFGFAADGSQDITVELAGTVRSNLLACTRASWTRTGGPSRPLSS
jgi:hypothetical protein